MEPDLEPLTEGQEAEAIRLRARQVRGRLVRTADALKETSQRFLDWRTYVGNHAWLSLGAAFVAGYMLAPRPAAASTPATEPPQRATAVAEPPRAPGIAAAARNRLLNVAADLALQAAVGFLGHQLQALVARPESPLAREDQCEADPR